MASATLIDKTGVNTGSVDLSDDVFGLEMKPTLVHDVSVAYMAAKRQGTHATKTRKEVRGGGRKPYRQKGTGNARHGSIREPQMRGGGVVFGPHPKSHRQNIPASFKRKALGCILSDRARSEDIQIVDALDFDSAKTKEFIALVGKVAPEGQRTLFVTKELNRNVLLSARNLPRVEVRTATDVNALDVLGARQVVIEQGALEELERRVTKRREKAHS